MFEDESADDAVVNGGTFVLLLTILKARSTGGRRQPRLMLLYGRMG